MSAHERTGWRDEALSRRHREWGYNCPAVDLDFVMVEYDQSEPVALIEYKHENAQTLVPGHPSLVAIRRLADKAGIYAFVVRYGEDLDWYKVRALNFKARAVVPDMGGKLLSEQEYVAFLHYVRGRMEEAEAATCIHEMQVRQCSVCNGTVRRLIGSKS